MTAGCLSMTQKSVMPTYDIYSGKYTDFEKVSVRKFLRADVTKDKVVNSADAVAIIANSK